MTLYDITHTRQLPFFNVCVGRGHTPPHKLQQCPSLVVGDLCFRHWIASSPHIHLLLWEQPSKILKYLNPYTISAQG
jgi:hypothetical protein